MCDHIGYIIELTPYFTDHGLIANTVYSEVRCEKCKCVFNAKKTTGNLLGIILSSWTPVNVMNCSHSNYEITQQEINREKYWNPSNGFSIMPVVFLVNALKKTSYTGTARCKMCNFEFPIKKNGGDFWTRT